MSEARTPPTLRMIVVIGLVFGLGSIYPFSLALRSDQLSEASEPSTCEVLSKDVSEATHTDDGVERSAGWYPVVEIAHTVDGRRYTRKDTGKRELTESDARAVIAKLRVGDELPCRYVAGSPDQVVALEQDPGQARGMLVFGALLLAFPIFAFLWARKQPGWKGLYG